MQYYFIFHTICFVYCLWRFIKRYKRVSIDGVIGIYPGLDVLMAIIFAPVLCITDLVVTWVYMYIDWKKIRENRRKVF